jgi:CHAT domain-containing protein
VSLWNVDDNSTGLLMRHFFTEFLSGSGKAQALRSAQLFVMQATVREAIAYCEEVMSHANQDALREEQGKDIIRLRHFAGDFAGVALHLDRSAALLDTESPERKRLHRAAAQYRARQNRAGRPDYGRRPYADPYHWAPFVLIGDWQ